MPLSTRHSLSPTSLRKLFVGGLSWETNEQGFREYFEKYGEIADVKIMEEPETKKPRGFGFVTFKDPTSVEKVLKEPSHFIDKKKVMHPPPPENTSFIFSLYT